jgi:hypothetical protein
VSRPRAAPLELRARFSRRLDYAFHRPGDSFRDLHTGQDQATFCIQNDPGTHVGQLRCEMQTALSSFG